MLGAFLCFVVPLVLHLALHTKLLLSDILGVNGKQKVSCKKDSQDWTDDSFYQDFR